VLPFDLNGFGSSLPAPGSPVRPHWDRDVAAAAGVLRARGVRRVVLIGVSLGGTSVMAAAADIQPRVAGVVDLSGSAESLGLDAVAAARRLRVSALSELAGDDAFLAEVRRVYGAAPPRLRKLIVVPGAGHGVGLLREALRPHAARDSAAIIAFFRAAVAA
jgi:pimeloyl-ACP methyl ester carboxylesterase